MGKPLIFITGASGCVGQYITNWLLENTDIDLILTMRDPSKIKAFDLSNQRINVIKGDLRDTKIFKDKLTNVTRVIHTATAWGDPERAYQVNVLAVKRLFNLLNNNILEQIIYFSTASILDKNLKPLNAAFIYGTEYIRTKAQCLNDLEFHDLSNKIVAVFPTLVFGGKINKKSRFPTSYLTAGLNEAVNWMWLARWVKAYSRFHFIHAADIASICGHLAIEPHDEKYFEKEGSIKKLVLGQHPLSIDDAVDTLLEWKGMNKVPRIPLKGWIIKILIQFLPLKLNAWDRFSINQRHFTHHPTTSPESFGKTSYASSLIEILQNS